MELLFILFITIGLWLKINFLALNLILIKKNNLIKSNYKMETTKEINIKNQTYYFYNDIIDIKTFDSNMLELDKKSNKNLDIYNIGYN